jgi:hypothetical protein
LATTTLRSIGKPIHRPINRRAERWFFAGMAFLILVSVFVGFARTYFLAGVFTAPLPNRLIHVHGAVFTLWIAFLVVQTSLVAAGRVDVHRRLGLTGFGLASLMVILGLWAATNRLHDNHGALGLPPTTFYVVPVTDILMFAVLIFAAYRTRFEPASHKRLIILATIAIADAAVARWPIALFGKMPPMISVFLGLFLIPLVIYDLWSTGKIHRATLWGAGLLIAVHAIRIPFSNTALWQNFAAWVQAFGMHH